MKICGLKLTHDAAVCGIENGELKFCVEVEKLFNNKRYTKMMDGAITEVLRREKFNPDTYVVDGWKHSHVGALRTASYHEFDGGSYGHADPTYHIAGNGLKIDGYHHSYRSYPHMTGHILGAYATSPFSQRHLPAYVLTWDGGQNPRVHLVEPSSGRVEFVSALHGLYGIVYGIMGYYFGPYCRNGVKNFQGSEIANEALYGGYDIPGKLMSYIALGDVNQELLRKIDSLYHRLPFNHVHPLGYNQTGIPEHDLMRRICKEVEVLEYIISDAEILRTIHYWLESELVRRARLVIPERSNLIFAGGSALNIKWNSALRNSGHFAEVWVPPFPNDSGSALGAAVAEMVVVEGRWSLDWNVYAGPRLTTGDVPKNHHGWKVRENFQLRDLASLFRDFPSEPVVFLNGRAEIGPRALGNRSILAAATLKNTKDVLNKMKKREAFRPVAPICLEEDAPNIFSPGSPDPYMLFDHDVQRRWIERVPAIVHLDGTARLQTVNKKENEAVYMLLLYYKGLTGIPLLCNTSANFNGSGFFPNVESAILWCEENDCRYIWSENTLYIKETE